MVLVTFYFSLKLLFGLVKSTPGSGCTLEEQGIFNMYRCTVGDSSLMTTSAYSLLMVPNGPSFCKAKVDIVWRRGK